MLKEFLLMATLLTFAAESLSNSRTEDSWTNLELSPNDVTEVPYHDYALKVKRADNSSTTQPLFYYQPVCLLDHTSAISAFNVVTGQYEMRFDVAMWNVQVDRLVKRHLFENRQVAVESQSQTLVQMTPIDGVQLDSDVIDNEVGYVLPSKKTWTPYQMQQSVTFSVTCITGAECDKLVANMRWDPTQFKHFKIRFRLQSFKKQSKEMTINVEKALTGDLASAIDQRFRNRTEAFITAADEDRLMREMESKITVETFDDSGRTANDSEIYDKLRNLLMSNSMESVGKGQQLDKWESTFWNDDNYRPDRVVRTLNEIHTKLDEDKRRQLEEYYSKNQRTSVNLNFVFLAVWFNGEHQEARKRFELDAKRLLDESKDYVEWDGERFVTKQLKLRRLDLTKLRDVQSLREQSVRARYVNSELQLPLHTLASQADVAKLIHYDQIGYLRTQVQALELELKETMKLDDDNFKKSDAALKGIENDLKNVRARFQGLKAKVERERQAIREPTSCEDLQKGGEEVNGIYVILGNNSSPHAVYCDFTTGVQTTKLGHVGVVKSPVYYDAHGSELPSIGGMSLQLSDRLGNANFGGFFKAPVAGFYFFMVSGSASHKQEKQGTTHVILEMLKNNKVISKGEAVDGYTQDMQRSPFFMHVVTQLNVNDRIQLVVNDLRSSTKRSFKIYFSGWLLKQTQFK